MRLTFAALLLAFPAWAQVPADVLARAAPAVLRIQASSCGLESRSGSGFAWEAPGRVVTALHVVAGCGDIKVFYQDIKWFPATVERSLLSADLVLLTVANPPPITPLATATRAPNVGETVNVYGFPFDQPTRADAPLYVTDANRTTPLLRDAVGGGERQQIMDLGFPSLDTEVLRVDGNLLPGHSGAPLLDKEGHVVGVGSGGLQRGAVGVGWAVRAHYLSDLAHAPAGAAVPASAKQVHTLFANILPGLSSPLLRCGNITLAKTRTLALSDLVATSDDPGGLMQIAATTSSPMQAFAGLRFDIWTETTTGGGIAVPAGATLGPGQDGCTAQWSDGALVMTVSGAALHGKPQTAAWREELQSASSNFERRQVAEFLPYLMQDPRFSYLMAQERRGGMVVNRKFFMGQKPDGQPPYAVFENLMAKEGGFMGITVTNHHYVPISLLRPEQVNVWVASAFAVHLSTFPP